MQFEINIIEIELSSLCNAKCSGCMRTILDNQGKYYYKGNLLLDDIIDWFEPLDISNTKIKMCGVLGDPMINPELYEIIFYFLYEKNTRTGDINGHIPRVIKQDTLNVFFYS